MPSAPRAAGGLSQDPRRCWYTDNCATVGGAQAGVVTQPQEEPARRHLSFCTLGVFTSRARAAACLASSRGPLPGGGRGAPGGAPGQPMAIPGQPGVLRVELNAPLRPCLGSAAVSARQTRLLVRGWAGKP